MRDRRFLHSVWITVILAASACSEAPTESADASPPADAHVSADASPGTDAATPSPDAMPPPPPDAMPPPPPDAMSPPPPPPDAMLPPPPDAAQAADAAPPAADAAGDTTPVVLSAATTTTTIGGHTTYTGSVMVTDVCPAGHVLSGFSGHLRGANGYNGPVQAICRPISAAAGPPVTVIIGDPSVTLPLRGTQQATDVIWTSECATNQVVVGLQGRAGAIIDQIVVRCAALAPSASDAHALVPGAPTALTPIGGTGGSAFGPFDCTAGAFARGAVIYHSGDPGFGLGMQFLDGIGLVCGTAVLP